MAKTVIVDMLENHIGEITLNRPDSLNTFTRALASELTAALLQLDGDPAVRVIILKGAGKAFCAGIDVGDFFGKSTHDYRVWIERMETPLVTISRMHKPVIAQVHGVAAANGAGLVAACDLGPVIPVTRSVGRKRAMEMLLYGELLKAPAAMDMGLINKVVPAADLEVESRRWGRRAGCQEPGCRSERQVSFLCRCRPELRQGICLHERGLCPAVRHRRCQRGRRGLSGKAPADVEGAVAPIAQPGRVLASTDQVW
jgi:enoyl-CoA hydratase/carnithine racemase